jgi:MFS family permease
MGYRMPLSASLSLFALMGLGSTGFTLVWASAKEVNPPALSGMATSVVNTGGFLGAALLQPLVGWALDLSMRSRGMGAASVRSLEDYRVGLAILLAATLMGLIAAFFVRETFCHYLIYQGEPGHEPKQAAVHTDS